MFYTYLHRRNDTGQVFYVGKGSTNRAWSKSSRSEHWKYVVAKAGYTVEICATWVNENDAFEHEVLLLRIFIDMGYDLVNRTAGGDGVSGHIHTAATRRQMSAAHKIRYADDPNSAKDASKKFRDIWSDPKFKARIIQDRKNLWLDPLVKSRRILAMHANDNNPDVKSNRSIAQQKAQCTPESRQKQRRSRLLSATPGGTKATPVTCLSTGDRFESAADAARYYGVRPSNVSSVCRGEKQHVQGLRFSLTLTPALVN